MSDVRSRRTRCWGGGEHRPGSRRCGRRTSGEPCGADARSVPDPVTRSQRQSRSSLSPRSRARPFVHFQGVFARYNDFEAMGRSAPRRYRTGGCHRSPIAIRGEHSLAFSGDVTHASPAQIARTCDVDLLVRDLRGHRRSSGRAPSPAYSRRRPRAGLRGNATWRDLAARTFRSSRWRRSAIRPRARRRIPASPARAPRRSRARCRREPRGSVPRRLRPCAVRRDRRLDPKLVLERANVLLHCGLRQIERLGGTGKILFDCETAKRLELDEIERHDENYGKTL